MPEDRLRWSPLFSFGPTQRLASNCLWPSSPASNLLSRKLRCACVAKIGLLRATAGVVEVRAHNRAFAFLNLVAAIVANEHGLTCHLQLLSRIEYATSVTDRNDQRLTTRSPQCEE